jgi:hypothetical protein
VPIEPGLRCLSGWLKEATGEVSDRPYPSSTRQPNASSKARSTSTGIAAPPEMHSRSVDTSYAARSGLWSNAENIVGTAANTVTWCPARICSARVGSKRGSRLRDAPDATAVLSVHVCPNEWNRGSPPNTTSSAVSCSRSVHITSVLRARLPWVSSAPFGWPVVPEV